eukprot:CAMPEP_0169384918 /NCGR_PEP_ID=MMETSP1017-20121227/43752_1 /TAXON_ID=342587 /ORGANISM="Karlodinium micrum, Strain CCMP2283" /LENGTH=625 /DNA_ID=CAMNT_0009485645 /DNA_START=9 /DNA_END=1886 /DNA_ORIENTATION=+
MTAGERLAIDKAAETLSGIAVNNTEILTGADPLGLVAPHIDSIGHAGLIEVVVSLLQRLCATMESDRRPVSLEPVVATTKQLALPTLARLSDCIISHSTFQSTSLLAPLLNRMALLSTQCCAVSVRDLTSAAAVLLLTNAMKFLSEVLKEAVLDRVEQFRPMDSIRVSRSYQTFADSQIQLSQTLAAELLGQQDAKRPLALAQQRRDHKWRNDELRQFWEARCAPKYDEAVPIDALAIFLLRGTSMEASLSNREVLMRRLAAIERKDPSQAVLSATEFDSCAAEVRRCGGLRAWVHALFLPGGVEAPGIGPLGTKQLAGSVPSMASTWGSLANSLRPTTASGRSLSASLGATPRGYSRKPFALTTASLKSARSARSDNGQGHRLFDAVERQSFTASRKLVLGEKVPVSTHHIAFRDTPLHTAAAQDQKHAPSCALLLEQGADPDAEDRHLATPLHVASASGHGEVAKKLIKSGAQICKGDRWQATPLHMAAQNGQIEIAQLLLQSGAQIDVADDWGSTPLHRAAAKKQVGVAEKLLVHNGGYGSACVNLEDRSGECPLHVAAKNGDYAFVRLLLEHGADSSSRSRLAGKTPQDCARDRGHADVVTLLQNCHEWIPSCHNAVITAS